MAWFGPTRHDSPVWLNTIRCDSPVWLDTIRHDSPVWLNDTILHDSLVWPNDTILHDSPVWPNDTILHDSPVLPNDTIMHDSPVWPDDTILHDSPVWPDDTILHDSPVWPDNTRGSLQALFAGRVDLCSIASNDISIRKSNPVRLWVVSVSHYRRRYPSPLLAHTHGLIRCQRIFETLVCVMIERTLTACPTGSVSPVEDSRLSALTIPSDNVAPNVGFCPVATQQVMADHSQQEYCAVQ